MQRMCDWKALLSVLPVQLRREVDTMGKDSLRELRLRINSPPELILDGYSRWLVEIVRQEDLDYVLNAASKYSPWCGATACEGYITAPGGHRIGICGDVIYRNGRMDGIRKISSLCIRVARDIRGIADKKLAFRGSTLILGQPGSGKTTLLRELIRIASEKEIVSVVDERCELFPQDFLRGKRMDVLSGCPKAIGMDIVLRSMGPDSIAVDEITAEADCQALLHAANCGVRLFATAHAGSRQDLINRSIYRPLLQNQIFDTLIVLQKDKTYSVERMKI